MRAHRMLDWCLAIQFDNGGFQGGKIDSTPRVAVIFNTGHILLGLAAGGAAYRATYESALHRAASWLRDSQDADGCWRQHRTPFALAALHRLRAGKSAGPGHCHGPGDVLPRAGRRHGRCFSHTCMGTQHGAASLPGPSRQALGSDRAPPRSAACTAPHRPARPRPLARLFSRRV